MIFDDDFQPRLGRMRAAGEGRARSYLSRVLAATNLAGGLSHGAGQRSGFTGARIGRGAGAGRLLSTRGSHGIRGARRVTVKTRIVRLAGKGAGAARAHLRYLQRDGVTREGEAGTLYGPESDRVEGKEFLERSSGDRHQFRFIVSAEDGARYEDLKPMTRRLMTAMEQDLDTRLDWVAVDHHNTGHPHTHILLRGKDDRGRDLVIARDYIAHGLRERAIEIVTIDLGPRSEQEIADQLRVEVDQDRLTSIDRRLLGEQDGERMVGADGRDAFDHAIRQGRLRKLERLGLAEDQGGGRWQLAPDLADTLTRMGERGDIIRTMQRAIAEAGIERAPVDREIYDPRQAPGPLVGRVLQRGLSDEMSDHHYLLVDGVDGRVHYVGIGKGEGLDQLGRDAVVRITSAPNGIREVDRTIVDVAATQAGRYDVDRHLRHDPTATDRFAETHVRRLEAIRRASRDLEREPSGSWVITPDHLEKVARHEAVRLSERPVRIEILARDRLDHLVQLEAATWIDRDLADEHPVSCRDAGFGSELRSAQRRRMTWLVEQGLTEDRSGVIQLRSDALRSLERLELQRVARKLADELGQPYAVIQPGQRVEGKLTRSLELASGRFALVERGRDFTLVPWRDALEKQIGKSVSGIMREEGVNWSVGRRRAGPAMS